MKVFSKLLAVVLVVAGCKENVSESKSSLNDAVQSSASFACSSRDGDFLGLVDIKAQIVGNELTIFDLERQADYVGERSAVTSGKFTGFNGLIDESGTLQITANTAFLKDADQKAKLTFRWKSSEGGGSTSGIFDCTK